MDVFNVVGPQHLFQQILECLAIVGIAQAAQPIRHPWGVVLQQDHQIKAVLVDQRLYKGVLASFVLFAERLSGHEVGIDKRHFIGVFHRKIDVLRLAQGDFVIVGILERHLIPAEV
ncbi:hypothetical protein D3C72_1455400 [compost metagenome]